MKVVTRREVACNGLSRANRPIHGGGPTGSPKLARGMAWDADQRAAQDYNLGGQVEWDGFGRTTSNIVNEDWRNAWNNQIKTNTSYDAAGRVASTTDPWRQGSASPAWPGYTTNYTYDALGRQTSAKTADSAVANTSYSGNQTATSDQSGHKKTVTVDGLGRVTQVVEDPNGLNLVTNYAWSAAGHMTTVAQGGQTRQFSYDSADRLILTTHPESGTVVYSYDNVGNLTGATDARGVSKSYTYYSLNRVTKIAYSDGTPCVTYT